MWVCVSQGGEELVKKVKGIFLFKITDSSGKETQWIVDLKKGRGSVKNTPGNQMYFEFACLGTLNDLIKFVLIKCAFY